jgi:ATP-dependent Zn protease
MKNLIKNILIVALILIAIVLIFGDNQAFNFSSKVKTISISELVSYINQGKLKTIEVKENTILATDNTNAKFTTKINPNDSIFDVLKYYNVDPLKLATTNMSFKEDINWSNIL